MKISKKAEVQFVGKKTENTILSFEETIQSFLDSSSPVVKIASITLALIALSGAVAVLAVAPGLMRLAGQYNKSKRLSRAQIMSATNGLVKSGYVRKETQALGAPRIILTEKGEKHFEKILFEESCLPDPVEWDGIWRFVLFDVPVNYTKARDALRFRLRVLGFYQYQKSVWAYPYPCEKEILFVADFFGVGDFVEILEVSHLTKDAELKKYFKL